MFQHFLAQLNARADYLWFTSTRMMPSEVAMTVVLSILVKLMVEAIISAVMTTILVKYLQRIRVL